MKSIIKELWYGNISGEMMNGEAIAQEKELMEYIVRHRSSLLETLSDLTFGSRHERYPRFCAYFRYAFQLSYH